MAEAGSSEEHRIVVTSPELGLASGTLSDVDRSIALLPRESAALRIVSVLTGLAADRPAGGRNVSLSLAGALGPNHVISRKLAADSQAVFIEPLQQLLMLRRALTLRGKGVVDITSDEG